jgi:hypothetical protein
VLDDHFDVAAVGQHPDVIKWVSLYQHQVSSSTSGQLTKLTLLVGIVHVTAAAKERVRQHHVTGRHQHLQSTPQAQPVRQGHGMKKQTETLWCMIDRKPAQQHPRSTLQICLL